MIDFHLFRGQIVVQLSFYCTFGNTDYWQQIIKYTAMGPSIKYVHKYVMRKKKTLQKIK